MSIKKTIFATDILKSSKSILITYCDDCICPRCTSGGDPKIKEAFYFYNSNVFYVFFLKHCSVCGKIALLETQIPAIKFNEKIDISGYAITTFPNKRINKTFPPQITELSPDFVTIYQQSENAETDGYSQICGMGYRKALEFLIKDFIIHKNPTESEIVSRELLSTSINRIQNEKIKTLASRCAWLGNDECHYVRKHEDYDLQDLKVFISAIVVFIESELTFDKALAMPHK